MEEEDQEGMREATPHDGPTQSLVALREAIDSPLNGASVVADAYHTCRFSELRPLISGIQSHLAELDVQPGDCVVLELANAVPSALLALSCLDAGLSVMLVPMEGLGARVAGSSFEAPRFCRFIATVRDGLRPGQRRLEAPESYIVVRHNPNFDPASAAARARGRLYLRTSGSLGVPKLVAWSLDSFLTNVRHARERLGLHRAHRVALPVPIFHGFGFGAAFLSCMFGGASVDLQDRSNLLRYLERERQFDPNVAFVTPSFCEILTRGRRAPRRYEFMLTGGDRIGQSAFLRSEEIHGPMISAYGCSEMGFVFCGDLGLSADVRSRTVGRPLPFVEFRVVTGDASSGDALGTLQIRYRYRSEGYVDFGGSALGYDGTLVDDGWYSSADLARPGPDGTVEVIGRQDLSVKRNSMLLPFADLEAALRDLDGVEDAGVAVGPEGIRGRMLVGYCAVRRGREQCEAKLRAELANRVPPFAVPERIRAVVALPRLPNGKIDRRTLASWALSETFPVVGVA
jgi:acyl-coenzyme A synthetase/AMP-(fatty) acid ligase